MPCQGTSNDNSQHMFSWRNKKKKSSMWIPPLIWSYMYYHKNGRNALSTDFERYAYMSGNSQDEICQRSSYIHPAPWWRLRSVCESGLTWATLQLPFYIYMFICLKTSSLRQHSTGLLNRSGHRLHLRSSIFESHNRNRGLSTYRATNSLRMHTDWSGPSQFTEWQFLYCRS